MAVCKGDWYEASLLTSISSLSYTSLWPSLSDYLDAPISLTCSPLTIGKEFMVKSDAEVAEIDGKIDAVIDTLIDSRIDMNPY